MPRQLTRYQHPDIANHLAAQYVLGQLSQRVSKRFDALRKQPDNDLLNQRLVYWQERLSPLNEQVSELPPQPGIWDQLAAQIQPQSEPVNRPPVTPVQDREPAAVVPLHPKSSKAKPWSFAPWLLAASICLISLLSWQLLERNSATTPGELSYVAVLTDDTDAAVLVAATYGDSQQLMLDNINLPSPDDEQVYELWVTSKTDGQARSLGEVDTSQSSLVRQLSVAQWRLIKDSDELLITLEEPGGSPIGEPMGDEVARGLCVRLSGWSQDA